MDLDQEFIRSIRRDVLLIFQLLKRRRKSYSLDNPEELGKDIYSYFHSHSRETVKEEMIIIKKILRDTMIALNSLDIFKSKFDRESDSWVRFYSWNLDEDIDEKIIDSCTIRLYLNPKLEHFQYIIVDLMKFYGRLKDNQKGHLMFKIPFWANLSMRHIEGTEKIVIYANPKNKLIERLEARLKSYPKDYFNDTTPLFTHEIRAGVAKAFEPKEENVFVGVLRRLTRRENLYLSYGMYMGFLIARGIQMAILTEGIKKPEENLEFNTLTDDQIAKIGTKVMVFVLQRCRQDLDL